MRTAEILRLRLRSQLIERTGERSPRDVVAGLFAVQAQDYAGATWAVALRTPNATLADIERAIEERAIVRTWPMRGTLHFLLAEDVRWLLPLLAPRVLARAGRREAQLELDAESFVRARELFSAALEGGRRLARPDAMALLDAGGIDPRGQRGYHILWRLAQEGLLVLGPMEGRQQTFALLDEWVPPTPESEAKAARPRESSLAEVAERYLRGHGPATVDDLARWVDITKREAAAAIAAVADGFESVEVEGARYWFAPEVGEVAGEAAGAGVHLLPGFDEYMLGYTGRSHQLGEHLETYGSRVASNGMLAATVVVRGRAVGVWKRTLTPGAVRFEVTEFERLSANDRLALAAEQERFARFLGRSVAAPRG